DPGHGCAEPRCADRSLGSPVRCRSIQTGTYQSLTNPELSVVVPAYREGRRIHGNLLRLLAEVDKIGVDYEVLLVSDGNTDETVSEARRVPSDRLTVLEYPVNIGKGFAVMHGVE